MRLDAGGGGAGSPRATHVSAVMAVMVMVVAGVMRVVMIMVVEMGWLSRCRCGRAAVHSLLLLEFAQPLVVTLDLLSEQRVLLGRSFFVVFEAADTIQPVHIDPTAPPHAHAVHDQMRAQVHL